MVGVTPNPKSVGGTLLINLISGGFHGVVYPVNPSSEAVPGIPCFRDVKSLPKTPDLGVICADARIDGVTVQPMLRVNDGLEMIPGIKKDPVFGTVMMIGAGGIAAELLKDRALGFPPINERLARQMLESLKIWPLLNGYRGPAPANIDKLIEVLIRLSYLAADYQEI